MSSNCHAPVTMRPQLRPSNHSQVFSATEVERALPGQVIGSGRPSAREITWNRKPQQHEARCLETIGRETCGTACVASSWNCRDCLWSWTRQPGCLVSTVRKPSASSRCLSAWDSSDARRKVASRETTAARDDWGRLESASSLPQNAGGFQGNRHAVVVRDDPCRVVRRRTRRRHLRAVDVRRRPRPRVGRTRVISCRTGPSPFTAVGVELHAHRLRVEVVDEQLNLERVVRPVGLDLHGAKPERGPLLLHRAAAR